MDRDFERGLVNKTETSALRSDKRFNFLA